MENRKKIPKNIAEAANKLNRFITESPVVKDTLSFQNKTRGSIDVGISPDGRKCLIPYTSDKASSETLRFQFEPGSGTIYFIDSQTKGKPTRRRIPHSFYQD